MAAIFDNFYEILVRQRDIFLFFIFCENVHANISSPEGSVFDGIRRHRGSIGWRSNIWSPGRMFQGGFRFLARIIGRQTFSWSVPTFAIYGGFLNWWDSSRGISHFNALQTRARELLCYLLPEFLGSISHLFSIPFPVLRAAFSETFFLLLPFTTSFYFYLSRNSKKVCLRRNCDNEKWSCYNYVVNEIGMIR